MTAADLIYYPLKQVPDKEKQLLLLFKERATEFNENYKDIVAGRPIIHAGFSVEPSGQVTSSGLGMNRHRLKGLLMDYRALSAKSEKIKFALTAQRIVDYFGYEDVVNAVNRSLDSWTNIEQISEWKGYKFDELVYVLFNSHLFHTDPKWQVGLGEVRSDFSSDAISAMIFFALHTRRQCIRNLLYILGPFSDSSQRIRLPAEAADC